MKKLKSLIALFALLWCSVNLADGKVSDLRLCADENCTTIVSMAKTLLNYNSIDSYMVSFRANTVVRVLSKAAGSNPNLWGIEVQGRRGYAPISHLRETEVIVKKDALFEVPTEPFMEVPVAKELPAEVQPTIDETTVQEEIISSERNDNIATVSTETQEQQERVDDNQDVPDSENNISEQMDLPEQQQGEEEIREHDHDDDQEDEGFEDEGFEDEDDVEDYEGREPVTEPPFIKKHAYQTGETEVENLQSDVELELIGSDAKRPEENNLIENNTVSVLGSDAETDEEPVNVIPEENAPEAKSDSVSANEIKIESQNISGETAKLPVVDTETVASLSETKHTDIKKEEVQTSPTNETPKPNVEPSIGTNETIPSGSNVEVENNEILEPVENVSVPVVASEASAPPLSIKYEQIPSGVIPADEAIPDVRPSSIDSSVDDFHRHIKNVLEIVQEPVVQQDPSHIPSIPSDELNGVNAERSSIDPSAENYFKTQFGLNAEDSSTLDQKDPIETAIDPEKNIETTEIPNAVEETSTPIARETADVPKIVDKVLPHTDKIIAKELPTTSPLPILDDGLSEDIFTSRPPTIEVEYQNAETIETVETGNWYDGIVEIVFGSYSSVLRLFDSDVSEKNDVAESQQNARADIDALEDGYCEKLHDGSCPQKSPKSVHTHDHVLGAAIHQMKNVNYDDFAKEFLGKVIAMADVVILLTLTATAVLIFLLGHYCLANTHKESGLISKLNIIEKKLLVSEKECSIVKADLIQTRKQLVSIEDSSFGSNDMVIALKQQLGQVENEKLKLQQQIATLEKELEAAAEAGLEMNTMITELLNNQTGSDSIISSVEELQRQLNEQETMTLSINNLLAEKSRENSELQILLSEKSGKFETEIEELLKLNDALKAEKESIEGELREHIHSLEMRLNRELESKVSELTNLSKEHAQLKAKFESISAKCQLAVARADALEDTLKKLKQIDGKADLKTVIEATDANAKLLALSRENESLKEKLEGENDARNLLEDHVKVIGEEITRLRAEYNQAEKDKLEAQTRLEVLSNYFKDKETQLQKELSVKEALFMKQQGESTSTVERIRNLQDEIQELKSQNDQLRAEIDAQSAAHKAQINAAESRAHDSWLALKQADRRFEEVRAEAGALRRKLTSLSTNPASVENSLQNHLNNGDGLVPNDMNAPSPIHMESPGSPLMNLVPPNSAPFLPPPPFIGAPPMSLPFMPPPPLVPIPGEMRPPPLGRLMSPPPPPPPLHPSNRFQPNSFVDDRGRYSNRFSPDSRYDDYPGVSTYENETDFSPPRSPNPRSFYRDRRDYDDDDEDDYSPRPSPPKVDNRRQKSINKGGMSSGSIDSSTSRKSRGGASKN